MQHAAHIFAFRAARARARYAGKFVVRSMSTTDAYRGQNPEPFHVYLQKADRRAAAYWSGKNDDTAVFNSIEDAQTEIDRCLPRREAWAPYADIVPYLDNDVPTYWDARKGGWNDRRVVGAAIFGGCTT